MKKQSIELQTLDSLINDDWFDYHFLAEFLPQGGEFREILNKKRYKLSDERLSSRVLNHWHEIGVLDDDRPDGKGWRKFSISEMMWISIIKTLRSFGMDMKSVKRVGEYLKSYNLDKISSKYCILDFYIAYGQMFKEPVKLIVLRDGQSVLCTQNSLETFQESGHLDFAFISIDINSMVAKGTHKINLTEYTKPPLSPIVQELEKTLSEKDLESVTIKVGGNNYLMDKEYLKKSRSDARAIIGMLEHAENKEVIHKGKSMFHVKLKKKIQKKG